MSQNPKRIHRVQVRLSDDEYDYFLYNLERTGMSKEAYLRKLLADKIPKTREIGQYEQDVLARLSAIGNNLNQIARRAHTMQIINAEKYFDTVKRFEAIMTAFLER